MKQSVLVVLVLAALAHASPSASGVSDEGKKVKLNGYVEWIEGNMLIVEGQRVVPEAGFELKGKDGVDSFANIPLGFEVKVKGRRQPDGMVLASKIEVKKNGTAMFEEEVWSATNELETAYLESGHFLQAAEGEVYSLGELYDEGPRVTRVRNIMNRLLPPYLEPDDLRVYVIDNEEWNAMAMGNYSIYVFSGLMDATDDDELAIVLGHELAHATHEHTRRQHKKNMWIQLAAVGAEVALSEIDGYDTRAAATAIAGLSLTAWTSGYGRDLEDQADRVGMRYAYEGGYDVRKGPQLWNRFGQRYGDEDAVSNFFFGGHSRSSDREKNLNHEMELNYRNPQR